MERKDQLFRKGGSEFYEWLFEPETFSELSRNRPLRTRLQVRTFTDKNRYPKITRKKCINVRCAYRAIKSVERRFEVNSGTKSVHFQQHLGYKYTKKYVFWNICKKKEDNKYIIKWIKLNDTIKQPYTVQRFEKSVAIVFCQTRFPAVRLHVFTLHFD